MTTSLVTTIGADLLRCAVVDDGLAICSPIATGAAVGLLAHSSNSLK
jgi:hypothetical protein